MSILLGNGDGTFQPSDLRGGLGPWAIVAGDFTGDGRLDLAVTSYDPLTYAGLVSVSWATVTAPSSPPWSTRRVVPKRSRGG